jgi:hypothetical protein
MLIGETMRYTATPYSLLKIHLGRVKAHQSYGYRYAVYKSGYPCAVFIGGGNTLKEAIQIAEKTRPEIKIHENEEPTFKQSRIDEDLQQLKEQRQEDFKRTRFK